MTVALPYFNLLGGVLLPDIQLDPLDWSVAGEPITVNYPGPGFVAIGVVYFGGGSVPISSGISIDGVTVPNITSAGGTNAGSGLFATMLASGGSKDVEWTGGTSTAYKAYSIYTPLVSSATPVFSRTSNNSAETVGAGDIFLVGCAYDTTQAAGGNTFTGDFTDTVDISLCDFGYSLPLAPPNGSNQVAVSHSGFRSACFAGFR
jgi:hypothetical protein